MSLAKFIAELNQDILANQNDVDRFLKVFPEDPEQLTGLQSVRLANIVASSAVVAAALPSGDDNDQRLQHLEAVAVEFRNLCLRKVAEEDAAIASAHDD